MCHSSLRRADDPGADEMGTPAELQVVTHRHIALIEAAELTQQVISDQGDPTWRHEDVTNSIVLALIELPWLDALDHGPEAVDALANVQQDGAVIDVDHLRRDDASVGPERLFNEQVHRIAVEHHVVVAEEEEGCSLDLAHRLVHGCPEASVLLQDGDESAWGRLGHPSRCGLAPATDEDEDAQLCIVLLAQGDEGSLEVAVGFRGHHDSDD